jgi:hypothetical protein
LQSENSKFAALLEHAWKAKLLTRPLLASTAHVHVSPKNTAVGSLSNDVTASADIS